MAAMHNMELGWSGSGWMDGTGRYAGDLGIHLDRQARLSRQEKVCQAYEKEGSCTQAGPQSSQKEGRPEIVSPYPSPQRGEEERQEEREAAGPEERPQGRPASRTEVSQGPPPLNPAELTERAP